MTPELEKAKKALNKYFCFTELQANQARLEGKELMEKEDMEFLLSLKNQTSNRYAHLQRKNGRYDSEIMFVLLKDSVAKGLEGMLTYTRLPEKDLVRLEKAGYMVKMEGPGMIGDEIYFSEDAFIRAEICSFQNLFGCLGSFRRCNII